MIEEIKKELTIKDVEKELNNGRVILELIDREAFVGAHRYNKYIASLKEIAICSSVIHEDGSGMFYIHIPDDFSLGGLSSYITESELKYFRIKRSSPTFDDLIDVAFNAVKNGVLTCIELFEDSIFIYLDHVGYDTKKPSFSICRDIESETSRIAEVIDKINSLYTETFVINEAADVINCKGGANIIFSNGIEGEFLEAYDDGALVAILLSESGKGFNIPFELLKGATVTQKRGG